MSQLSKLKILNTGINSKDIANKICKGRQIIRCLNSLWWDKNISMDTKKRLGKAMVEWKTGEEKRKTVTIMEEPSDGLHEKQKNGEDMAEDRHLCSLGVEGRLLAIQILIIIINDCQYTVLISS